MLTLDGSQVGLNQMARLSLYQQEQIKKHIADRHYYLKQARQSIKLKQISEMHSFCEMAEIEQARLDMLTRWHGAQYITR
jgi:hypothetical protein